MGYSTEPKFIKGTLTVNDPGNAKRNSVAFKNNAPFSNSFLKSMVYNWFGVQIDNAEDLDVVMPIYILVEYSKNYGKTIGSFWKY